MKSPASTRSHSPRPGGLRTGLASLAHSRRFLISFSLGVALFALGTMLSSNGARYGLYSDDWTRKERISDLERGQWVPSLVLVQPNMRPIGQVIHSNLAAFLPDYEPLVRLIWALVHLGVVGLAAWFAYRVTHSPLASVVAGGVLLFPLPAHEAIFWHSGAANATAGTFVALISLHLLLSAVIRDRHWIRPAVFGLVAFALIPQFYEQPAAYILVLPLLVLVKRPPTWNRLWRALALLASAGVLLFLHWFLVLRNSYAVGARGGLCLPPSCLGTERLLSVARGVAWFAYLRYETAGYLSAWDLGIQRALGVPLAILVLPLLVAGAAITLFLALRRGREFRPGSRQLLLLLAIGCFWMLLAFVPILIIRDQIVESRLLYFPWVGAALAFSASLTLLVSRVRGRWSWALGLALGVCFAVQLPVMAGFGQVYKLRYEDDQRRLAALAAAVPRLPARDVVLMPTDEDQGYVSLAAPGHARLEALLLGAFEADWSAQSAARLHYHTPNIEAVTRSKWRPFSFTGIEGHGSEARLFVNGRSIPAAQLLAFAYQNGRVVLHDRLVAELPGGNLVETGLPLAREVAAPGTAFQPLILRVGLAQLPDAGVAASEMFDDLVTMTGYSLQQYQSPETGGNDYALRTDWFCSLPIESDYTLYMHYLDASGTRLAQDDHLLGERSPEGFLPTSQWVCPGTYSDLSLLPGELVTAGGLEAGFGLWLPESSQYLQPSGALPLDQDGRVRIKVPDVVQDN